MNTTTGTRGWLIGVWSEPVEIPFKFLQPTVESLQPEKWEQIKQAYLAAYPNDEEIKSAFGSLENVEEVDRRRA